MSSPLTTSEGIIERTKLEWEPTAPAIERSTGLSGPGRRRLPSPYDSNHKNLAIAIVFTLVASSLVGMTLAGIPVTTLKATLTITDHAPILINNSADFASQAANESWSGVGSASNPYIISALRIDATGFEFGIEVFDSNVYFAITNCIIQYPNQACVYFDNVAHGMVSSNSLVGGYEGVHFFKADQCEIINNTLDSSSGTGMYLESSENLLVELNKISYCGSNGIYAFWCNWTSMNDNTMSSNIYDGISLDHCTHFILDNDTCASSGNNGLTLYLCNESAITNCTFDYCSEGIYLYDSHNDTIGTSESSGNYDGIYFEYSTNVTVSGCNFTGNDEGIYGYNSANCTLSSNNCTGSYDGIYLETVTNISVIDNNCSGNDDGMYLYDIQMCSFLGNNCSQNYYDGIYIETIRSCDLTGNMLSWNSYEGIDGYDLDDCTLMGNNCSYESDGIFLGDSSSVNITGNECGNDANGIYLQNVGQSNITENKCSGYQSGIHVHTCSVLLLQNNSCSNGRGVGMYVYYSSDVLVLGNDLSHNEGAGLFLLGNTGDFAAYNTCSHNGQDGVYAENEPSATTLANNTCSWNRWQGIDIEFIGSVGFSIVNNTCNNNALAGILVTLSSDVLVLDNECSNTLGRLGIELSESQGVKVHGNVMVNDGLYIIGSSLLALNTHNVTTDNLVNGKPVYYFVNTTGIVAPKNAGEVLMANCSDSAIENLKMDNGSAAVELGYCSDIVVANNSLNNGSQGVIMSNCNGILIHNNSCSNVLQSGVVLYITTGVTVSENDCTGDIQSGVEAISSIGGWINNNSFVGDGIGVVLSSSVSNLIDNNTIIHGGNGVCMTGSSAIHVADNNINENSADGIYAQSCTDCTLIHNELANDTGYAINLLNSERFLLKRNSMVDAGILLDGSWIGFWQNHSIDTSNTVNGKPVQFLRNVTGGTVPLGAGEVILVNCTGVVVEHQNLSDGSTGAILGYSYSCTVRNNTCSNGTDGIRVWFSSGNTISNNSCSFNDGKGIWLVNSDSNTVRNNTVAFNVEEGLRAGASNLNEITGNLFYANGGYGIMFDWLTYGNTIVNNTFAFNRGSGTTYDFMHIQADDESGSNSWYVVPGTRGWGNYWSDWTTPDGNHDGIVDNQYVLDGPAGAVDLYPLVNSPSGPVVPIPEFGMLLILPFMGIVLVLLRKRRAD